LTATRARVFADFDEVIVSFDARAARRYGWTSTVGFDIEADTFAEAVLRAIEDVEGVPGLSVVRVEPDQLVWGSEIADRIGRSRRSLVRRLRAGPYGSISICRDPTQPARTPQTRTGHVPT
jgi:hypothetical protein